MTILHEFRRKELALGSSSLLDLIIKNPIIVFIVLFLFLSFLSELFTD